MLEFLISTGSSLVASILFALISAKLFKSKNNDNVNLIDNFKFSVLSVIIFVLMMTYVIFNFGVFANKIKDLTNEQFLEFVDKLIVPVIKTITTSFSIVISFLLGSGVIGKLLLKNKIDPKNKGK